MPETDFLVVGSGIAGLSCALHISELRPDARITIVSKSALDSSSSALAQGGIAAVTDFSNDSHEQHIADTIAAGDGLCHPEVVDFVVREASERIGELSRWGVEFDKDSGGAPSLAREGGHSARRILHTADNTGAQIITKLIAAVRSIPQISILEGHFAAELICKDNCCAGIWLLAPSATRPVPLTARATILATGGVGRVFLHTTNPPVATGDGIAMAWRAGAATAGMEFIQFHPTALPEQNNRTTFLISEAVRGAGAILLNARGDRFMKNYDPRMELATRDIVARAVHNEMHRTSSPHVYLDCTRIPADVFASHFPNILAKCLEKGLDPRTGLLPVAPAAHYCCGGIVADHYGRTSIDGLYAVGECAGTGLHGANRLASNSLLEALVFAKRTALHCAAVCQRKTSGITIPDPPQARLAGQFSENILLLRRKMSAAAVVIRQGPLDEADLLVKNLRSAYLKNVCGTYSTPDITYGNQLDAAHIILTAWKARKSNAGAFFMASCPQLA